MNQDYFAMNQPIGRRDPEWATTGAV